MDTEHDSDEIRREIEPVAMASPHDFLLIDRLISFVAGVALGVILTATLIVYFHSYIGDSHK